jgi:hypothetical protein
LPALIICRTCAMASPNGARSAGSAGMMTVMVLDLLQPTDEIEALCTFVARDLYEVRGSVLDAWERPGEIADESGR